MSCLAKLSGIAVGRAMSLAGYETPRIEPIEINGAIAEVIELAVQ